MLTQATCDRLHDCQNRLSATGAVAIHFCGGEGGQSAEAVAQEMCTIIDAYLHQRFQPTP